MIQDIYPHKLINKYDPDKAPTDNSPVLVFSGKDILMKEAEGVIDFPRAKDFSEDAVPKLQFLFSVDEEDFFLAMSDVASPEGFEFVEISFLRTNGLQPRYYVFACYTAIQLAGWYRDNKYCGTCGGTTSHSKSERALVCDNCGRTIYPRILPAVIVGVTDGDRILITKYANRIITINALIAGFTEIGETLEETVEREVMEEVGLKVKNIRYYKSQPWGVADDILMGFYCDLDGDDTIRVDQNELKEAVWTKREDVVGQPNDYSLTNEMMIKFRDGEV